MPLSAENRQEHVRFSVIVPTFQRRDLVLECVQSLTRQRFTNDFEIIVVVDGSTDGTAGELRRLSPDVPLTVVEQANLGLSAARNAGAAIAQGELLLFLDDDMEADARLLAEHDREHRDQVALVLGHIPVHADSPANFLSDAVGAWGNERRARLNRPDVAPELQDCVMGQASIPRALFFDLGRFDDKFTRKGAYGNEDLDFCHRARQAGVPIIFNANAISWQRYTVSTRAHLQQWYQSGAADVQFVRKHPELVEQIFPHGWRHRWLASIIYRPLRWLSLFLINFFSGNRLAQRLFFSVRTLCYAQGVESAGSMPRPRPLQILCYHAIADLGHGVLGPYGIREDRFRAQIEALKRHGHHFISASEFSRFLCDGAGLPKRALLLTFDDCYQSLCDAGLPILEELGVPGVAFAVSARIGASNDWDAHLGAPRLALADKAALKNLETSGIAIASHSCTHRNLRMLSVEELCQEVTQSSEDLRTNGFEPIAMFAYPYGEHDQRIRNAVQIAGFDAAMTTERGIVGPGSNRFRLPRIEVMARGSTWGLRFRLFRDRFLEMLARRFNDETPNAPSVSVIIPAFNAESTLVATLASVSAQTSQDWEAIIVDDGSTDATGQIANTQIAKDPRFQLLTRENGGEAAARNTGIVAARGDWLVFLDSDDWLAPEYLERMFETVGAEGLVDAVVCGCARVAPSGVITAQAVYGPTDLNDPFPKFVHDCPIAIHNCMIKRSIAVEIGPFDESLKTCADWDFWQRAARSGVRFGTVPDVLALYRIRAGSSSTNASRVLADGHNVIRRGYRPDTRVRKVLSPEYRDGLKSDDLEEALFRHTLWPASMKIVSNEDPIVLLDSLAGVTAPDLDPELVGDELFHDIPLAAGETTAVWPKRYSALERVVREFLGKIEQASGATGLAEKASRHLERRILETSRFDSYLAIGESYGARIDITDSIEEIQPDSGKRQLVLVVMAGQEQVGTIVIPVRSQLVQPAAIVDAVVDKLSWQIMRIRLGLNFPRESPLSFELHRLVKETNPIRVLPKLIVSCYSLLKWQKKNGVLRNRAVIRDIFGMLGDLDPLSLGARLWRVTPGERNLLLKTALSRASKARVQKRYSALAARS